MMLFYSDNCVGLTGSRIGIGRCIVGKNRA